MYDVTQPVHHEAACVHTTYTHDQLLSLYTPTPPIAAVIARLRAFNLYTVCRLHVQRRPRHRLHDRPVVDCYRGCRAGRTRRRPAIVRPTACGAGILVSNSPSRHVAGPPSPPPPSSLVSVPVDRHSSQQAKLTFGCLNICSLANKLDDLLEVRRDQLLDVMFLVETWHDSDSVSLGRLRSDGFK